MAVHPGALLETTLRCKERAIEDRSHSEHTTHDGTCSRASRQECLSKNVKEHARGQKVRKRLAGLSMGNEYGRDFIVEEGAYAVVGSVDQTTT